MRFPAAHGRSGAAIVLTVNLLVASRLVAQTPCVSGWAAVGGGVTGFAAQVNAVTTYVDDDGVALYVAGYFDQAGGVPVQNIARFDGTHWTDVGGGVDDLVTALTVFDDGYSKSLYAAGLFHFAGGVEVNGIARWDGQSWHPLGVGLDGYIDALVTIVNSMVPGIANGEPALFVGGLFEKAGGIIVNSIASWNGREWSAVGGGLDEWAPIPFYRPIVGTMAHFNDGSGDALYVGGYFDRAGGHVVQNVARWNGFDWLPVGAGIQLVSVVPVVQSLTELRTEDGALLIAGGGFNLPMRGLAAWNGARWLPFAPGLIGSPPLVHSVAAVTSDAEELVFATGSFNGNGSKLNGAAVWDLGQWHALGAGLRGAGSDVTGFVVAPVKEPGGTALYVGGVFDTAGGIPSPNIARWGCNRADMNCDGIVNNFDLDPFILAVTDGALYETAFPNCNRLNGDMDGNGSVDNFDVPLFMMRIGRL